MMVFYFFQRFPWLRGACGITGANKKIKHPHVYVTVKRGYSKTAIRFEIKETFGDEAVRYVELLREKKK